MTEMPKRDTQGKCEGECRDRVRELQEEQQREMAEMNMEHSTEETPSVKEANKRDNPPGELGGHV